MATLNVQPYGLRGAGLVYANADAAGDVAINRPGLFLAVRNVHATLDRDVQVEATAVCTRRQFHDLEAEAIPPTPVGAAPWLIPLGANGDRFPLVAIEYPTAGHAADLRVAVAYIEGHQGRGLSASAPAMGPSPGTVQLVEQSGALEWADAVADGMRVPNGDGRSLVYVHNEDAADHPVYVRARGACSHGFLDHYSRTIPAGEVVALEEFDSQFFGTLLEVVLDGPSFRIAAARRARA